MLSGGGVEGAAGMWSGTGWGQLVEAAVARFEATESDAMATATVSKLHFRFVRI